MRSTGILFEFCNRLTEATELYKVARDLLARRLGPQAPEVAMLGNDIAIVSTRMGKFAAAIDEYRRALASLSLHRLPLAEKGLIEFLLLLPVAALLICIFRNVIGLSSFGTFAPALLGLAFRDLSSLPGLGVFVAIVLIGWLLTVVGAGIILASIPMNMDIYFRQTTLFNTIVMLGLLFGGLGLVARSLRAA